MQDPHYASRSHRLVWFRTPPFHGENTGSNPVGIIVCDPWRNRIAQDTSNVKVTGSIPVGSVRLWCNGSTRGFGPLGSSSNLGKRIVKTAFKSAEKVNTGHGNANTHFNRGGCSVFLDCRRHQALRVGIPQRLRGRQALWLHRGAV